MTDRLTDAEDFVDYLNAAWTNFHCVAESKRRLSDHGFVELSERVSSWSLEPNGKYFFSRNATALVAFAVGGAYTPASGSFVLVGAHTDSPCLKLKPYSAIDRSGMQQLAVQTYGGGLWTTWFDRDLSVAGRVLVRDAATGAVAPKLVKIERPICRIPSLAIHLERGSGTKFEINAESHLAPVIAAAADKALGGEEAAEAGGRHSAPLLGAVAAELGCAPGDIVDLELQLCDTQPSSIGGVHNEFVHSGRLDNLCCAYLAVESLAKAEGLAEATSVRVAALYDHEEVGSCSAVGAKGPLTMDALRRIVAGLGGKSADLAAALQRSLLISADMAHGLHPNYASKHEPRHAPQLGKGFVVKHNANQRYATNSIRSVILLFASIISFVANILLLTPSIDQRHALSRARRRRGVRDARVRRSPGHGVREHDRADRRGGDGRPDRRYRDGPMVDALDP
jgi:aspartyl aminopeptidase